MATQIGLTVADFEHMSIGMIFDHIITYNNHLDEDEPEVTTRQATVDDMVGF